MRCYDNDLFPKNFCFTWKMNLKKSSRFQQSEATACGEDAGGRRLAIVCAAVSKNATWTRWESGSSPGMRDQIDSSRTVMGREPGRVMNAGVGERRRGDGSSIRSIAA